jgi:excinuclease ABC subunit A
LVAAVDEAWRGLEQRLRFLREVGLGYLTLEREYGTLSGGETQRVRLATQLGMGLVGVAYVLDEPSIGLHPRDNRALVRTLLGLRDLGNAVIVVEHDADMIRAADRVIELGPGAGAAGGRLLFEGTPAECAQAPGSHTGPYLSGRLRLEKNVADRFPDGRWLRVRGASEHNLRDVDAAFPVGLMTVVCGVSGSGKSTLVNDILGQAAAFRLHGAKAVPGRHRALEGLEHFESVVRVDQEPIGRSPRSNPATYTKIFDLLRELFAQCPLAKVRGYRASRFSFNVRGGRCERCQGDGVIRLDMQFLEDVRVECPSCRGRRYNRETLEVRFKGLNIADALDLAVAEALRAFRAQPRLVEKLRTLDAVGLGYLKLGQAADTLSGGEAQRLKLSLELSKRQQGGTLYLLDEPTTGLHWEDIQRLMDLLGKLRDAGNTIVIIEHHLDVVRLADWVLELGPGGGPAGGRLVYAGAPAGLRDAPDSPTGACLREPTALTVN